MPPPNYKLPDITCKCQEYQERRKNDVNYTLELKLVDFGGAQIFRLLISLQIRWEREKERLRHTHTHTIIIETVHLFGSNIRCNKPLWPFWLLPLKDSGGADNHADSTLYSMRGFSPGSESPKQQTRLRTPLVRNTVEHLETITHVPSTTSAPVLCNSNTLLRLPYPQHQIQKWGCRG